jgi:tRNA threonylcarbamoyladenosine biosynthesis protein TsaB
MKILAVDTATRSCSVAIVDQGSLLAEITTVSGQTHSKHLMDMIHAVLQTANLTVSDVDGWAVSAGPGSFTGLRIGMSTIKGLAVASGKPVAGVSSLEVLAWQVLPCSDLMCPMLDARKGQVYCARYRSVSGALVQELPAVVLSPGQAVRDINKRCVFVGDGAQHYESVIVSSLGDCARIAFDGQHIIRASSVAWLSLQHFESGHSDDPARLVPYYIRKSDAELRLGKSRTVGPTGSVSVR